MGDHGECKNTVLLRSGQPLLYVTLHLDELVCAIHEEEPVVAAPVAIVSKETFVIIRVIRDMKLEFARPWGGCEKHSVDVGQHGFIVAREFIGFFMTIVLEITYLPESSVCKGNGTHLVLCIIADTVEIWFVVCWILHLVC